MVRNTLSEGALRRLLTGGKLGLLWPVTVRITLSEGALRRLLAGFQLLELRGHPSLRGGLCRNSLPGGSHLPQSCGEGAELKACCTALRVG